MKRHHVVCGFALLFVFLATMQTQGAVRSNTDNRQFKESKGVVFVNRAEFSRLASRAGVTIRIIKISKRELVKLASSGPTGRDGGGGHVCADSMERATSTEGHPRGRVCSERHVVAEQPPLERTGNRRSLPKRVPRVETAAD